MLARVANPCLVNERFAWTKIVECPSALVQFVSACSESRQIQDFVKAAVSLCPLSQEREHQLLRFRKAYSEVVQALFTKPGLCFGH